MGPPPPGGRRARRADEPPSARSLLVTVLGEFLLSRREPVWTVALVTSLAMVGVEEKAARQALGRLARRDLVASVRHGRRASWRLTPAGTRLLAEGADRIFSFGQATDAWDGRWLVVGLEPPGVAAHLERRLASRLTWAGLGSPLPGLWISPDAGRQKAVEVVLGELGIDAFSLVGTFRGRPEELRLVRRAWALADLEARYRAFLRTFGRTRPRSDAECFAAQVRLVEAWSRFPYLDPALPCELLPATWPGPRAAEVFRTRHGEWHERAQAHFDALVADAAGRR